MIGRASGRDQHVFCPDSFAIGQAKRVGIFEYGAGLDDARAGLFDIRGVDALQPRDLLVLVGDQRRPVEGHRRDGPSKAHGVLDLVVDVRSNNEKLFRHAAADHAGAAHPVLFGDHDPRAVARGDSSGANPARTSSDDEQIDLELSHIHSDRNRISGIRFLLPDFHLEPGITNRYCSPSFETATSRPPQDEVSLVETQQPHAEERATRASRSMGSKRLTYLSWSVLAPDPAPPVQTRLSSCLSTIS